MSIPFNYNNNIRNLLIQFQIVHYLFSFHLNIYFNFVLGVFVCVDHRFTSFAMEQKNMGYPHSNLYPHVPPPLPTTIITGEFNQNHSKKIRNNQSYWFQSLGDSIVRWKTTTKFQFELICFPLFACFLKITRAQKKSKSLSKDSVRQIKLIK